MWEAETGRIVPSIAKSVLTAAATQYWTASRSSQLESETLGWILLFFFITYNIRPRTRAKAVDLSLQPEAEPRTGAYWIVAVATAAAALCSAENDFVGPLLPALTPALLLIQKQPNPQHSTSRIKQPKAWTSHATTTTWSAAAISLLGIHTLAQWNLPSLALSVVELLALLALYGTLLRKQASNSVAIPFVNMETDVASLTPRVASVMLAALVLRSLLLGFVPFDLGTMLLASVARAASWYFVIETAHHLSWTAAAVIKIFVIFATRSPFIQSSEMQALSHIVCSSLTLGQLISLIPKQVSHRKLLWALMVIPVLPYLANMFAIRTAHLRTVIFANTHEHPVETIIQQAKADFNHLLLRQSKSYTIACEEYRRRYELDPPPGFDEWFKYANAHDSKIIDDFDVMYESITPLWSLSGEQIRQAMRAVQLSPENEVWTCKFSGRTGKTDCIHNWRSFDRHLSKLFAQLMGDIKGVLPDVEFLVNHLDEPRVMFPGKQEQYDPKPSVRLKDLSRTPTWASLVQYCSENEHTTAANSDNAVNSFDLPWVQNISSSRDICKHPSYRQMHGLFISPTSFRLIEGMVPVLSTGSPSTMGDILFPSPAYIESEFVYSDNKDLDWSSKTNNVYWAGSTSGAFATDSQWEDYHRQRFVSLVQMLDGKEHLYLADKGGIVQRVTSSFLNSRLFDVAFTKIFQCATRPCREQSFAYRMKSWADKDEALRSRLTFDLDGNGISGRWYKMVASKSAPMKQTLLREWHDDRLLPWVHFIPVSLGMTELPELVMYLTSTKQGQQRAKEIADQGREWFSQALRNVDMSVYVYRLLLELARLQDPERPAFSKGKPRPQMDQTV
ncbi:hypothetical protein QQS21_000051 [Conoideocrella luteorostrata]|uniref:Glycosyl transferase CAP10 domain-containing protein n=1 Tax=Conoideocrella luteorostrata TaxID=1105319 RepID=A0AAJ0D1H8_9HYPO|nr:hypothetical protein QQS21_000051 [Conoideocrella luteorostrata]